MRSIECSLYLLLIAGPPQGPDTHSLLTSVSPSSVCCLSHGHISKINVRWTHSKYERLFRSWYTASVAAFRFSHDARYWGWVTAPSWVSMVVGKLFIAVATFLSITP